MWQIPIAVILWEVAFVIGMVIWGTAKELRAAIKEHVRNAVENK